MSHKFLFGRHSAGLFFAGIVCFEGSLRAEFGPRKFQRRTDNAIKTYLPAMKELENAITGVSSACFPKLEMSLYLDETQKGLHALNQAHNGIQSGKVKLEQFFAPEAATGMTKIIAMGKRLPIPFQDLFNIMALIKIAPACVPNPDRYERLASDFPPEVFVKDWLVEPANRKPLPNELSAHYW